MIRIAADVQVGARCRAGARRLGVDVVVSARRAEPDEQWFRRAMLARVRAVASPDYDLERLCRDAGVPWIQLPGQGEVCPHELVDFVEVVLDVDIVAPLPPMESSRPPPPGWADVQALRTAAESAVDRVRDILAAGSVVRLGAIAKKARVSVPVAKGAIRKLLYRQEVEAVPLERAHAELRYRARRP